ncbi:hypothetical protein BSL78_26879 [Apostichopus japonicus]|uniref:Poly(A) RNA polymerase mitochondrial-like central palm domain-containing protein n=1 Tax=Stichopus japonicus TaxID=307972 RepID=A0A2G8JKP4_STIJA|nr:hypothetical protein BSL78_26879 [Apostichopus japonicus]
MLWRKRSNDERTAHSGTAKRSLRVCFQGHHTEEGCLGGKKKKEDNLRLETQMLMAELVQKKTQVQESSSAASSSSRDADGASDGANPTTASDGSEMEEDTLDPDQAPEEECLEFVAQIIQKCVPSCHKVQTIASARKPAIKFVHKDSGLHCDIILNNRLVLRNTELIHFYCTLDPVVRPLILLIRRWAKLNHVAENSGPGPRLIRLNKTNYALTWMVILFLQTEGIVPTIEELREAAGLLRQAAERKKDEPILMHIRGKTVLPLKCGTAVYVEGTTYSS